MIAHSPTTTQEVHQEVLEDGDVHVVLEEEDAGAVAGGDVHQADTAAHSPLAVDHVDDVVVYLPNDFPFSPLSLWVIKRCSLNLALAVIRSMAMGCWWGLRAPQIPWLLLTHSLPAIIGWIELARVLVLLLEELVRLDIRPMIALEPLAKHELRRG